MRRRSRRLRLLARPRSRRPPPPHEPPPALIEATEAASAACQAAGGTPRDPARLRGLARPQRRRPRRTSSPTSPASSAPAPGTRSAAARGCPVSVWLSAPGGGHDRFDLGPLRGFSIGEGEAGGLPAVVALYDVADCGPDASTDCTRTWRFSSNAPDTPPVDAPVDAPAPAEPAAAAPKAAPAIAGWTLRRVPGASPVALGAGVGQHRLARRLLPRGAALPGADLPRAARRRGVALDFAFSQGALEVSAGYEETAGGAFVVALADGPLADRLGGRDSEVAVSVDGTEEGVLSLEGSTKALRGALAGCGG